MTPCHTFLTLPPEVEAQSKNRSHLPMSARPRNRLRGGSVVLAGVLLLSTAAQAWPQSTPPAPPLGPRTTTSSGSPSSERTSPTVTTSGAVPDLCSLFPSGFTSSGGEIESYERASGLLAKCTALYPNGSLVAFAYDAVEKAQKDLSNAQAFGQQPRYSASSLPGLGDAAIEVRKEQTPPGNADSPVVYQLYVRSGCVVATGIAGGAFANYVLDEAGRAEWEGKRAWARAAVSDVTGRLGGWCPGGRTDDRPRPAALGVDLACQHNFEDPGLVVCTATPSNAPPGAFLSYAWTFDGAGQRGTGTELTLTGVSPGSHVVTVVGRDEGSGLASAQQSVSFEKRGAAPPVGGGFGGGLPGEFVGLGEDYDDDVPVGPILTGIGIVTVLGATGVVMARRRRRRPKTGPAAPPAPPEQRQPAGSRPSSRPEALAPPPTSRPETAGARPSSRPEALSPARPKPPATPPPSSRPETVAAKPAQPRLPTAPVPISPVVGAPLPPLAPGTNRTRQEGEIWLEADQTKVVVRGDGRQNVAVRIVAKKLVNGVPTDASQEVRPITESLVPKKIYASAAPGPYDLRIRGANVGSVPVFGRVRVNGVVYATGAAVPPVEIEVEVAPIKLEVRINVWKKGFLRQETVATLPGTCGRVRGRVEGGPPVPIEPPPPGTPRERRRVVFAHCSASLQVDGGGWSSAVEARTDDKGGFWFDLPLRLVQTLGADIPVYDLPVVIDMGLGDEAKQALESYTGAVEDCEKHSSDADAESAYARVRSRCREYASVFVDQLRDLREEDYGRVLGAIHRLRCSIRFSLKYRRDFKNQRSLVDMAANDFFGAALDVLTDIIPVAGWIQGEEMTLAGRRIPGLPELLRRMASAIGRTRGFRWMVRLATPVMNAATRSLRALADEFTERVAKLLTEAGVQVPWASPASKAGLPRRGSGHGEVPMPRLPSNDIDIGSVVPKPPTIPRRGSGRTAGPTATPSPNDIDIGSIFPKQPTIPRRGSGRTEGPIANPSPNDIDIGSIFPKQPTIPRRGSGHHPGPTPPPPSNKVDIPEDDAPAPADAAEAAGFGNAILTIVRFGATIFLHVVAILAGALVFAIKLAGKAAKSLFPEPYEGSKATLGEVIEQYLGNFSDGFYEAFITPLERLFRALFGLPAPAGTSAAQAEEGFVAKLLKPGVLVQESASALMDRLCSVADLDVASAAALEDAYSRSVRLDVIEEWQPTVTKVSKRELTHMALFQQLDEIVFVTDHSAATLKFAVKIVQAIAFVWATAAEMLIRVLAKLAIKVVSTSATPRAAVEGRIADATEQKAGAMGFSTKFEQCVDAIELCVVRLPILAKELAVLIFLYYIAPTRIRDLYRPI